MGSGSVAELIRELPDRFFAPGGAGALDARVRIKAGRVTRDVVVSGDSCRVEQPGDPGPDVEVAADDGTWVDIWEGRLSGIEAFAQHRLVIRGSIEKALRFEPLFERPDEGGMRYRMERVDTGRAKVSTLVAGDPAAPPLLMIHGLGATKSSWLTIVPGMSRHFRVLAVDLPGFGSSSKPITGYDAGWFGRHVEAFLDSQGLGPVLLAGNSMGGRVAMEVAMRTPERVPGIACLCPAAAFRDRPALAAVRMLRPELGVLVARLPRKRLIAGLRDLFGDPNQLQDAWFEAAVDKFLQIWKSPRARIAFFAAARQIYLDEPMGEEGFWERLAACTPPTLYVYGGRDVLITPRFADRVRSTLPSAEVHVWSDCGHVPQIEFPARTHDLMLGFYRRCLAAAAAKRRGAAAAG